MRDGSITLGDAFERDYNNFNPIRLIAACLVIYGHAYAVTKEGGADFVTTYLGYGFTGGLAVDAFFIISGLLVTASVMKGDIAFYLASRVLRILPALWVCVALTAFVWAPLVAKPGVYSWAAARDYFSGLASLTQYKLFLPGVFSENRDHGVNGVLWSVIVEARMYLLLLLIYLTGVLRSRTIFNGLFFALLIASFFSPGGIILATSPTDRHVMLLFFMGAFAWVNRHNIVFSPVGVMVCLFALSLSHLTPKFELAYLVTFPYLVLALAFGPRWPWPRRMGDYSYGVYLWGWPIQQLIVLWFPSTGVVMNQLIAIPVALLAGALSWHFVEQPILGQKRRAAAFLHRLLRPLAAVAPYRARKCENDAHP